MRRSIESFKSKTNELMNDRIGKEPESSLNGFGSKILSIFQRWFQRFQQLYRLRLCLNLSLQLRSLYRVQKLADPWPWRHSQPKQIVTPHQRRWNERLVCKFLPFLHKKSIIL